MTIARPPRLDEAFQRVRTSEAPLGERLQILADVIAVEFPDYADAAEAFISRLEHARAGTSAPAAGTPMPGFTMPDQDGRLVSLDDLLERSPVVLALHRGHWCPYCHLNIVALTQIEEKVRPAQIVAMSPETQRYTRLLKSDAGAGFPFLTDIGAAYALSLNLAVWFDDRLSRLIAESGCDVPLYTGTSSWILPIPAVFVIGQDGIIAARHVDPDYRRRMEREDLLRGVDLVLGKADRPVGRAEQVEERARFA